MLFHGKDHPWRTDSGYAMAARYLVQGLYDVLDLGVFAPVGLRYKTEWYYPELGVFGFDPQFSIVTPEEKEFRCQYAVPIFPGISEDFGENIVEEHFQHFHAEILWMIADAWGLGRIPDLAKQDRIRWVIQPPVDFLDPIPPSLIQKLSPAMKVVPWVKDGQDRLIKAGLSNVTNPIPLGINTEIWSPKDRSQYPDTMGNLGFGFDTCNISIVAANQYGRKAWEQALKGIKLFREKRHDVDVRLYVHTYAAVGDGWDMNQLLNTMGLADVTRQPDPYQMLTGQYSEHQLMLIHALSDIMINAGLEGFGYSTIQAQAVGTPVIGLNAGATPELVKAGILVPPYSDYLTQAFLRKTDPNPIHIAAALEQVYETPRPDFRKGVQFVHDNFAWPLVIDKWKKFFEELDVELNRKCIKSGAYPPHPSPRALEKAKEGITVE